MRNVFRAAILVGLVCVLVGQAVGADTPVKLFNGKNLDGWQAVLVDPGVKMEDVWSVDEGILVCRGEPLGYIYTTKKFKDFKLVVEWRWAPGKEPGNSGVLLRIQGKPVSFLPKCIEAQLKSGDAGDVWAFYGAKCQGDADRMRVVENNERLGTFMGVGKIKGAEKEPGQWNKYEITMKGGDLTLLVNGEKVNEATGCTGDAGPIGLQSEGGEIHFRTVTLTPLEP